MSIAQDNPASLALALAPDPWTDLLDEFKHFAEHYCQISPETVAKHKTYLNRFYAHFHAPPPLKLFAALSVRSVQQFVF